MVLNHLVVINAANCYSADCHEKSDYLPGNDDTDLATLNINIVLLERDGLCVSVIPRAMSAGVLHSW